MTFTAAFWLSSVALLLLALNLVRPRHGAAAAVFLLPWMGLDVDVGLRVSAYQIAAACLLVGVVLRRPGHFARPRVHGLTPFAIYAITWTLVVIPFLPELRVAGGALRSSWIRPLAQVALLVLQLAPVYALPAVIRRRREIERLGKTLVVSTLVLAAVGWLQLGIWTATRENPFPIGAVSAWMGIDVPVRDGVYAFGGGEIFRMNSFGGEPKNLGQSLVMSMLLIQAFYLRRPSGLAGARVAVVWLALFASMLATLSTSAIYLLVLGSLAQITVWLARRKPDLALGSLLTGAALALALLTVDFRLSTTGRRVQPEWGRGGSLLQDIVLDRTVGRGVVEDYDVAILRFLRDRPERMIFGTGLGAVHLYTDPYIPRHYYHYMAGKVIVAKSGYLWLLSGLGIVGALLFLAPIRRLVLQLDRGRPPERVPAGPRGGLDVETGIVVVLSFLVCFLARSYVTDHLFVALGSMIALVHVRDARDLGS